MNLQRFVELAYRGANLIAIIGALLAVFGVHSDEATSSRFWTVAGAWMALVGGVGILGFGRIRDRFSDARTAWRTLSPKQRTALVEALRGRDLEIWNTFVGDDPESTNYRADLEEAFVEAGVKTHYFSGWVMSVGLSIVYEKSDAYELLASALKTAKIPFGHAHPNTKSMGYLTLIVGTKPPP